MGFRIQPIKINGKPWFLCKNIGIKKHMSEVFKTQNGTALISIKILNNQISQENPLFLTMTKKQKPTPTLSGE